MPNIEKNLEIIEFRNSKVYKWQVDIILEIEKEALIHSCYQPILKEFYVMNKYGARLSGNKTSIIIKDNNIIGLRLFGHQLKKFPETICMLTELKYLDFIKNYVEKIPEEIGNLTKLEVIDLSGNFLASIPESFGKLVNLKTLDLSGNYIEYIPKTLGNLKNLQRLFISANNLKKIPDEVKHLEELKRLYVAFNDLSQLPADLFNLKNLEAIYLLGNSINDPLEKIENFKLITENGNLKYINALLLQKLDENIIKFRDARIYKWQADILISIEEKLVDSHLEDHEKRFQRVNHLTYVKCGFKVENHNVIGLSLSKHNLTQFPLEICQLVHLKTLGLYYNSFGEIPSEITQLTELESLDLPENEIDIIPDFIEELHNLKSLHLSHNKITNLPESIGNLKKLKDIGLYGNKISSLPDSMKFLINLEMLDLSWNNFTSVPLQIANIETLRELKLDDTPLKNQKALPEQCGLLKLERHFGVRYINPNPVRKIEDFKEILIKDEAEGSPMDDDIVVVGQYSAKEMYRWHKDIILYLENELKQLNKDTDDFGITQWMDEGWIKSARNRFEVKNLKINGLRFYYMKYPKKSLEKCIKKIDSLEALVLSQVDLSSFPDFIKQLKDLKILNLSSNQITLVPDYIGDFSKLEELDLSRNLIQILPESIGKLKSLTSLKISSNKLKSIPDQIGEIISMKTLEIEDNFIKNLPNSLGNLINLERFNFEGNEIVSLPKSLKKVKGIQFDIQHYFKKRTLQRDLTLSKSELREFLGRLASKGGCGGGDFIYAREVLDEMDVSKEQQEILLDLCKEYGGFCDCEILMNAAPYLLEEETPW